MRALLKPEAMQRTVILAPRRHQAAVIDVLHDLQAAHFVEFHESARDPELRMGAPLPAGGPASERLVRVRALLRHLGLEGADAARPVPVRDLEGRMDASLDAIERDVGAAVEARESVRARLAEGREMQARLEPLRALPLRLEDYRGYDTLAVFTGRADAAFLPEVQRAAPEHLLAQGEKDGLFALFVPKERSSEVSDALFRHGYAEVEVPQGSGSPDEAIRQIEAERAPLQTRLEKSEQDLKRLAQEHRDFLLAAEEHLAIAVEKAEAPLSFASTENAFVVDAWVPASQVDAVEAAVRRAAQDNVHVMRLETQAHGHGHGHGHDDHHGHASPADAGMGGTPEATLPAPAAPPTKYANPRGVRRFEWFTNLFSVPRYDEVDPTPIFAIFFPLFFGFMIGDLGLGLVMVLLGWLLVRKLHRVDGMKQLGTAFMVAGGVAAVIGGVVFMDAFGIPLGVTHHLEEHAIANAASAGVTLAPGALTCHDLYRYAHEPTWGCLVAGDAHFHAEPLVGKVTDVTTMLLISAGAAFVHLLIGLLIGIRNQVGHGAKHLAAKVGYLILLLTFFPAVLALLAPPVIEGAGFTQVQAYMTAGVGFVIGAVILGWAEGFGGVLEIPSMFSAIMSYLRLGAVAIAKGAMAIAFNQLTLVAALTGGGLAVVLGLVGFVVVQMVLFVLGVLSGAIQA
ncbi:MAG TPA: V-type ATPase 116kDa subunit family protein, partial [Candidatus Thermoplasmatota archaeon]|nr:V-type ATPase 116kDa subunit family protein [Candidatus Thermoplasmatota archaeon]